MAHERTTMKAAIWTLLAAVLAVALSVSGCKPISPMALPVTAAAPTSPLDLKEGPHLFVDDYLIEVSQNVTRKVNQPQRFLQGPVIGNENPDFRNTQWMVTVIKEPEPGVPFRLYYAAENPDAPGVYKATMAYADSDDGVHFRWPFTYVNDPRLWTPNGILDDRGRARPGEEFKSTHWRLDPENPGMKVAFSPDGKRWALEEEVVIPGLKQDDIWNPYWDPFNGRYAVGMKLWREHEWTDRTGKRRKQKVRLVGISFSEDFRVWSEPELLFAPDNGDTGVTQFYGGPAGVHRRGDLLIGFLKILRDDVTVKGAPQGAYGMGYTVLAWSRDGIHWERDREPFFAPDPRIGAWDHAHAWIDDAVPVGDELYLYYGGYKWGHKYGYPEERQIGLVKMKRDRYVAREAGADGGWLRTPLVTLDARGMTLNVNAEGGEVGVQVVDAEGDPIPGLTFADCQPITTDSLDAPVHCARSLEEVKGIPIHLEFRLRNAQLFAFTLSGPPAPTPVPTSTYTPTSVPTSTPTPVSHLLVSHFLPVAPEVDGELSEWVAQPGVRLDAGTADYVYPREVPDEGDASVILRSGWDERFLYFALEIRDDVLVADSEEIWRDDSIELGIDGLFDHIGWRGDDHQFTVNLDGRVADFTQPARGVTVVTGTVSGGWVVEMAIGVDRLGAGPLEVGKEMGFTFGLHDDDDGGDWESYLIWAGDSTNDSSAEYGHLLLEGALAEPTYTPTALPIGSATISGRIWNDLDGDGMQDAAELGIAHVTISLEEAGSDGVLGTGDEVVYPPRITDGDGRYEFTGLPAGLYRIEVNESTLPAGYVLTTGREPLEVLLSPGQEFNAADLGYARSVAIGDYIFVDSDVNGVPGPDEVQGINGVVVTLTDTVRSLVYHQVSHGNGNYLFTDLPPGTYTIAVWDVPGLRRTTDSPQTFTIVADQRDLTHDFGFIQPTGVQVVWFDASATSEQVSLFWWVYLYGQEPPSFTVWRSVPGGDWVRVTAASVMPISINGNMATYIYTDVRVEAGVTYLYRLEEKDGEIFGPWQVPVPGSAASAGQ